MKPTIVSKTIICILVIIFISGCMTVDMQQYAYVNEYKGTVVKNKPNVEIHVDDTMLGTPEAYKIKAVTDGMFKSDVIFKKPIKDIIESEFNKALISVGYNIIPNANTQYIEIPVKVATHSGVNLPLCDI